MAATPLTPASPLPWHACDPHPHLVRDKRGTAIFECWFRGEWQRGDTPDAEQNARYIVTACNAFPELVEALRQLDEFQCTYHGYTQDDMPGNEHYSGWLMRIVVAARAALAKAEATPHV
jgi:hypothetical protein